MLTEVGLYVLTGVLAGGLAGLFGVGGGLVIVPVLVWIFTARQFPPAHIMPLALGSSLAIIVFTALSSVIAHHRRQAVQWRVVMRLAPGVMVGALAGGGLAQWLGSGTLRWLFGGFELVVALQLALRYQPSGQHRLPGVWGMGVAGGVIGGVSALLGVAGGTLTVPFLLLCQTPMAQAVATSSAVGLALAVAGAVGYVAAGWSLADLPSGSAGYVYWPAVVAIALFSIPSAPLGAAMAHRLPPDRLRQGFASVLVLLGAQMLIG